MAPRRRRQSLGPPPSSVDSAAAEEPVKSKKPANTAFRQQRLRAWQPTLTPRIIIVVWSLLAVLYLAAGGVLFWISTKNKDFQLDYTDCQSSATSGTFSAIPTESITAHFKSSNDSANLNPYVASWQRSTVNVTYDGNSTQLNQCIIKFNIPEDLSPPVFMYYRLQDFYQNHRRYVNSYNLDQLKGKRVDAGTLNSSTTPSCQQLGQIWYPEVNGMRIVYPCGLIANSWFNDTYDNPVLLNTQDGSNNKTYPMDNNTGIAWDSDAELYGTSTEYNLSEILPPPNWKLRYPNGYTTNNPPPNLKTWQSFHNWMRTAATSTFSKPYQQNKNSTMSSGQYQITIVDNFNVTGFGGRKYMVISTLTALGGRNPWIGIIFLVTGGFALIMTIIFTVGHLLRPRKMGDHTYLSWNNAPAGEGR